MTARKRRISASSFPIASLIAFVVLGLLGWAIFPSSNNPITQLESDDVLEISVDSDASTVEASVQIMGEGERPESVDTAKATILVTAQTTGTTSVDIYAESAIAGLVTECRTGVSPIPLTATQNRIGDRAVATWLLELPANPVRATSSLQIYCDLNPQFLYSREGAMSVLTIPTMRFRARNSPRSTAPEACANLLVWNVPQGAVDQSSCDDDHRPSESTAIVEAIHEFTEFPGERASQERRTLISGILLGLAGGFAATTLAWLDPRFSRAFHAWISRVRHRPHPHRGVSARRVAAQRRRTRQSRQARAG